jgi:hypothetical protein
MIGIPNVDLHLIQDLQRFIHADRDKSGHTRPIRFLVGRFENDRCSKLFTDRTYLFRRPKDHIPVLNHTGTGK